MAALSNLSSDVSVGISLGKTLMPTGGGIPTSDSDKSSSSNPNGSNPSSNPSSKPSSSPTASPTRTPQPLGGGNGSGPLDVLPSRARLVQISNPANFLNFDYNPEKVDISRAAEAHNKASVQASNNETALKLAGNLLLTLEQVRFVGLNLEARMELLLSWTQGTPGVAATGGGKLEQDVKTKAAQLLTPPGGGTPGGVPGSTTLSPGGVEDPLKDTISGTATAPNLEKLSFTWGEMTPRTVTVKEVSIGYTRFSTTGLPLAATVTKITLQCYDPQLPGTNPTSGGLPGRSRHTLVAGEDLVGLATATYGTPRSWRALAEANGLDDPLRMRPGREIYLPSPQELSQPGGV